MDDNLAPHLSDKAVRIMMLFKKHHQDIERLLAANPDITPDDVAQVSAEVMAAMAIVQGEKKSAKSSKRNRLKAGCVLQLKITLRGSKPPIWRRVLVPGELRLDTLHWVIQMAMGWQESHLHAFTIDGERYSASELELENGELEESKFRLCDLIDREKAKFSYEYDFGDGWEHLLVVEKIIPSTEKPRITCVGGKGRCPPEDCGGIWGYYRLLEVLANPADDEHESMMEWTGGPIDPTEFDEAEVNKALSMIKC